jgi:hypothetical protein
MLGDKRNLMSKPRALGVLLCYNDGDILAENIEHLLHNGHDVVAWNHGSTDETAAVLDRYRHELREATFVSRDVDFYDTYPLMSKHLLATYVRDYDWISWPDQDEILEGPDRSRTYREWIDEAFASPHNWIAFNDFVFWFTSEDVAGEPSVSARVCRYAVSRVGPRKIRAWRASATNIRWFNHNPTNGTEFPTRFNLRHYPMRSAAQMERRLNVDRAGLQRGHLNCHYENMRAAAERLRIPPSALHFDDGRAELVADQRFDWRSVYGGPPVLPPRIELSFALLSERWHLAAVLARVLRGWRGAPGLDPDARRRLGSWLTALRASPTLPALIVVTGSSVTVAAGDIARRWDAGVIDDVALQPPTEAVRETIEISGVKCRLGTSAAERRLRIDVEESGRPSFLALVPVDAEERARLATGPTVFELPVDGRYILALEPPASASADSAPGRR